MIRLILYSRVYCHLCEDMLAALSALSLGDRYTLDIVDVDDDAALIALYDELVPVLAGSRNNGPIRPLCHYFLDEGVVRSFLAEAG